MWEQFLLCHCIFLSFQVEHSYLFFIYCHIAVRMNVLSIIIMSDLITPYLRLSRSCAWTSSPRLPTWLTTPPWRTPSFLELNLPAYRPRHLLWVSFSHILLTACTFQAACLCSEAFFCSLTVFISVSITEYHYLTFFVMHVILPYCAGQSELSGVPGEDSGVSRQVVCHWWDPALPTTDPLQRTSSTYGHSR